METKHTEGPLSVSVTGMLDDYKDGPFLLAVHAAGNYPRDVYETALIVCNGDITEDEAWANGKLYAAAPDLLAACKLALRRAQCDIQFFRGSDATELRSLETYRDELQAAIAKAEGQAVQP